jgi:histidyl-tRNA synthetase
MAGKDALSTEPYKGVRDFYPGDWAQLQAVFETMRKTLKSYGYEEYNASPLEPAELYESKTSEEIVNEQTFTWLQQRSVSSFSRCDGFQSVIAFDTNVRKKDVCGSSTKWT